jgi:signal transduction histidine kinase
MVKKLTTIIAAVFLLSGCSFLENWNNERRVKKLVNDAVEIIEEEGSAAFERFTSEPWLDGESYVFVHRIDGVQLFHAITPEFDGRNRSDLTDANGVTMVVNMIEIATGEGRGWTEYHFENPESGEVEAKRTYIASTVIDDEEVFVGSGYYIEEADEDEADEETEE